jgi:SAM-dependent methyltransferase
VSAETPWGSHARQWSRVGPPLRPSPEDVAVARSSIESWRAANRFRDPTILLMGVTPELCSIPTGRRSRLIAVDRSLEMIRSVWPGRLRPHDEALCGEWRRLPIRADSVDMILSDGCLSTLDYPSGYAIACSELLRMLRGGGRFVARCFVQPRDPESVEDVLATLDHGASESFHAFKWRLAMALQPDAETGVVLAEVWEALHQAEPEFEDLSRRCGWRIEAVRTIDAYRGVSARYSFPPLDALCGLLSDTGFEILDRFHPAYELGERCPTLILAPRDGKGRE